MATTLEPMLYLSRLLASPSRDSSLTEALELLLSDAGCSRGAVYVANGDVLELAGHAGLPSELRDALTQLPRGSASWFLAQRAAQERAVVIDRNVPLRSGERLRNRRALTAAGWAQAVACPIVAEHGAVLGVVVMAAPANEELGQRVCAVLEIGCNLLALYLPRCARSAVGATPAPRSQIPAFREARTAPAIPSLRAAAFRDRDSDPPPTPVTHGALVPSARDHELEATARDIAATVRRDGPTRGGAVLARLRARGLPEMEALSVITYALATGILVRQPAWSTYLKAADPQPKRTVLLVDDDADLRAIVAGVLDEHGYAVQTASNGVEALAVLRGSEAPDVVVLDLTMPIMDGWQFLRELQGDGALGRIPVVVVSSTRRLAHLPHCIDGYLTKPLDLSELVREIERSSRERASMH